MCSAVVGQMAVLVAGMDLVGMRHRCVVVLLVCGLVSIHAAARQLTPTRTGSTAKALHHNVDAALAPELCALVQASIVVTCTM